MAGGAGRAGLRRSGRRGRGLAARPAPDRVKGRSLERPPEPGFCDVGRRAPGRALLPGPALVTLPYIHGRGRVMIIESIICCGGRFA